MDLAALDLLQTAGGLALLDELARLPDADLADSLTLLTALRARGVEPTQAAAALTQTRLRRAAIPKLGERAATWLFTKDGFEQATGHVISAHRAARLASLLPEGARVLDLCCGIGADTIAMADAGLVITAIERDQTTAAIAKHNIAAAGHQERARVIGTDATSYPTPEVLDQSEAVFIDPARRNDRGRVFNPDSYSPPLSFVESLLTGSTPAVAKVAPGLPHDRIPVGVTAEWVSDRGGLKEATLWGGSLHEPGVTRRATVLPSGVTLDDRDEPDEVPVGALDAYLLEPDDAVIRAGLVGAIADRVSGRLLDSRVAYVTSDVTSSVDGLARCYRVQDSMPFSIKVLRAYVTEHGIGQVTIKKRAFAMTPEQVRAQLRLDPHATATATFVLTRIGDKPMCIVVEPVTH
jgi:THUMP domain-like/RNA cap guanine-N2 methyltransferase